MIWTYCNGEWRSKPVRMTQAEHMAAFMCCPGPSLSSVYQPPFQRPGIFTVAINSAYPKIERPDMWIGGDTLECHHPNLIFEPFPKYFQGGLGSNPEIRKQFNVHFVDSDNKPFLSNEKSDYVSFPRSTFLFALELIIRMGFRKIYLVGCDFSHENGDYWHNSTLTEEFRKENKGVHEYILAEVSRNALKIKNLGVEIFSCTSDSPIRSESIRYVPLYKALAAEEKNLCTADFKFRHVLEIKGKRDANGQFARVGFTEE